VRDLLSALASVFIFLLARPGLAQNQDTTAALVLACDRAAASPTDKNRPVGLAGVPSGRLDSQNAIAACEAAATAAPDNPRIMFQLGRAHAAAKANESARAYFSKASDLGYAAASASLGDFYASGRGGLARNYDEALRLFKLAAEQGDPLGNNYLGFFYKSGRGGLAKDDREAARLYLLAADDGEPWGQYNLGRLYQNGRGGLIQNDREASRYFGLAADQGNVFAQVSLGFFYETGRGGLPKDDLKAVGYYKRAADQGNAVGQNNLGWFYQNGRGGLPQSDQDAARLYQLAADQGNAAARNNLGNFYRNGRGGLPQSDQEAVRLYQLAADQGNVFAQVSLGFFYATGRGGLPKDDVKAVGYYKRAADQGNALGQAYLGFFYANGRGGLTKDDQEAARLFKLAADQANALGRNNLGVFYQNGRGGLPQSDRDAARLYQLAAEQGNALAQANLGFFYETGRGGIPQDEGEAARLYGLAAEQGGPFARNRLATFYEEGRGGLPKNNREAARLYKLVSEQDDNLIEKQKASDALTRLDLAPAPPAPSGVRPAIQVIGFLDTAPPSAAGINRFRTALKEAGFVEGKNVAIDFRWTNNRREMQELAADMVRRHVDLIVASGSGLAAVAAKAATDIVPIVITGGTDPVQAGWVKSLNRPGGNVTGITTIHNQLAGKRLAILLDLVPVANTLGYLVGVNGTANEDTKGLLEAARRVGREVIVIECRGEGDLERAFEKLSQRQAGGLIVSAFPLAFNNRNKVVALAARYKIPTIYAQSPYAYRGGLMSYMGSISESDLVNQYVRRILEGDKPADLPIQTPSKFELILNLRTAKALGLTIPETLLATADKVIE
jgi:TPR repeat protein/ABC-type uncharacterized transport system substrate-binding protein